MAAAPLNDDNGDFWPALLTAALLGGRQAAPPPLPAGHPLADQLPPTAGSAASQQLLRLAGAWDWYQRTGRHAGAGAPLVAAPPFVDPRPVCPPPLTEFLRQLLAGRHPSVWQECLTLVESAGLRLPPALLPDILEWGRRNLRRQGQLRSLLGPLGQWLATQNEDWWYARPTIDWADLLDRWRPAPAQARGTMFNILRQRDPALARDLLQNTWSGSDDQTRIRLVRLLGHGLSLADEPFLELALADRHQLVRRAAAEMLSGLPGSAYARRFAKRAAPLLGWRPAAAAPATLTVRLPGAITKDMQRDGVPVLAQSDRQKQALRQRQLGFIIAAAPLTTWTEQWQQPPAAILAAAANSRFPRTLSNAFAAAAIRQDAPDWAAAVLRQEKPQQRTGHLVRALPPAVFETLIAEAAAENLDLTGDGPLLMLLHHWHRPLTAPMAAIWQAAIAAFFALGERPGPSHTQQAVLRHFATACPPATIDSNLALLEDLLTANDNWQAQLRPLRETLRFRRQLLTIATQLDPPEAL